MDELEVHDEDEVKHPVPKFRVSFLLFLGAALFVAVTGMVVAIVYLIQSNAPGQTPFDPLGVGQLQLVQNKVAGVDQPAVYAESGDDVVVIGSKCNTSGSTIRVHGHSSWVAVEPPGTVVDNSESTGDRLPGCTTRTYRNPIPPGVLARVRQLASHGISRSVWHIAGTETPEDPQTGRRGVQRTWETGNLVIIAGKPPGG